MANSAKPNQESYENEKLEKELQSACERLVHQNAKISVPVSIQPYAIAGTIKTKCCGQPHVIKKECKDVCYLFITQEVSIEIPIQFGALTETNETHVDCDKPTVDDCK